MPYAIALFVNDFFSIFKGQVRVFFYVIRDSCVQEKGGTKRIKLNISQFFLGY